MADTKVEIYTDKQGRRRRRVVPIDTSNRPPRSKSKGSRVQRTRGSLSMDPRTRVERDKRSKRKCNDQQRRTNYEAWWRS